MKSKLIENREAYLRDLMYATQRRLGIRTQKRMAEQMGMTEGTYKQRLSSPGGIRLTELWALEDVCRHAGMELDPAKILRVQL